MWGSCSPGQRYCAVQGSKGSANTRGSMGGAAAENILFQKQGRQDVQQLVVLENAET